MREVEVVRFPGKIDGVDGLDLEPDAELFCEIGGEGPEAIQCFLLAVADHVPDPIRPFSCLLRRLLTGKRGKDQEKKDADALHGSTACDRRVFRERRRRRP